MSDTGAELLGMVGEVSIYLVETATPWDLEIDTLVIAVEGSRLGQVGETFLRVFPSVPLYSVDLSAVTPQTPVTLPLPTGSTNTKLARLVLTTVAGMTGRSADVLADLDTSGAAAREALRAGVLDGGRHIGLPLLRNGLPGWSQEVVAQETTDVLKYSLHLDGAADLESVVLFDVDPSTVDALRMAWRVSTGAPSVVPEDDAPLTLSKTAEITLLDAALLAFGSNVTITPQLLWYAALHHGWTSGRRDVATELVGALSTIPNQRVGDLLNRLAEVSGVDPAPAATLRRPPDPATVATVRAAVPLAARVNSDEVRQRHLLAAAALDPAGAQAIAEATGWSPPEVRRRLREAIATVLPQEFPEIWDEILTADDQRSAEPAGDLAAGLSEDAVAADARIPMSEDSLNLNTYVTMLGAAIAREDTPLPLSIGLFGEWGSGKSYFMGLLRHQIETFEKSGNGAYLTEIEQITFNAWHYTDANLWASLASTIFERLGRKTGSITDDRQGLIRQLDDDRSQARQLQDEAERARRTEAELRAELDRRRAEVASSGATLLKAVGRSQDVLEAAELAWRTLGIESDVAKATLLAREAEGLDSDWLALRRAARGRRAGVLVSIVIIAIVLFGAAAFVPGEVRQWLTGGSSVVLVGVLATGLTWLRRARGAVQKIAKAITETEDAALALADEKLEPLHSKVDDATKRAADLATKHDEVAARIGDAEDQLSKLDPSRRWYDFVAERAASPDYQRELGLISIIRRDFEQLITLMKDWRNNPNRDDPALRPINRIVLYIDDLDRCSPKQVMDVLQAVHLILALDLFVVVVGVDPRWLLQSLRHQYRDNFSGDAPGEPPPGGDGWAAEPLDYLEKIFNIPFVLPRMTAGSFTSLIEKISTDSDQRADRAPRDAGAQSRSVTHGSITPSTSVDPGRGSDDPPSHVPRADSIDATRSIAPPVAEEGSEVQAALRGKPAPGIGLTPAELVMLATLGPIVASPREAKRLLNVYRTLRSLRAVGSASDFLNRADGGGDYQALAILLGVISAKPALLGQLLWNPPTDDLPGGLCHRSSPTTWADIVDGLRPRSATGNNWCNDLGPLAGTQDCADWTRLLDQLAGASALVTLADLGPFQIWGPHVARFSFILSPLAASIVH